MNTLHSSSYFLFTLQKFGRKDGLKAHESVHTGEKRYFCHECQEVFLMYLFDLKLFNVFDDCGILKVIL